MRPRLLLLLLLCLFARSAFAGLAGNWKGTLEVGIPLRLTFEITEKDGKLTGVMRSLDQGGQSIALDTLTEKDATVRLGVKSIGGLFEGKMDAAGNEITGTWTQGPAALPLKLTRTEGPVTLRRPQVPKKPYPYRAEQVTIPGATPDVTLAGTLTLPTGSGPFPTVVLITGSGPQDRDESLMGHRPFLVLADHLTRHGIAVLRCDDRGVGKSKGDFLKATTADFADDTRAQLAWLRQRSDIDPKRLGLIGHSEGGIVAPLVAATDRDVAFIVLLAGVGVPMKDLLVQQSIDLLKLEGAKPDLIAAVSALNRDVLNLTAADADAKTLEQRFRDGLEKVRTTLSPDEAGSFEALQKKMDLGLAQLASPWIRWIVRYDPAPTLREVRCPVLAINGDKDAQVAAQPNLEGIARALTSGGNTRVKTAVLPGLNHLFQTCQTGAPKEYGDIEETFAPAALDLIADWVCKISDGGK